LPKVKEEWAKMRDDWMRALREKVFRGWPEGSEDLNVSKVFEVQREGVRFSAYDFDSQKSVRLRLFVMDSPKAAKTGPTVLEILDGDAWQSFLAAVRPVFEDQLTGVTLPEANFDDWNFVRKNVQISPHAWVAPRGVGLSSWDSSPKKQLHNRRRFMLLGQTLAGMQVYDVRRAIQTLRSLDAAKGAKVALSAQRHMAVAALYASLFEPNIASVTLISPPNSHDGGPDLLNVRRFLDLPVVAGMAADRAELTIYTREPSDWSYPKELKSRLGWEELRVSLHDISSK
jgi:hypothetical protein